MKSDYTDENLASSSLALNPRNRPPIKRSCCKRVSRILFSHIGLVSMVVIYSVLGGFLFEILEQHNEKSNCEEGSGNESVTIVQLTSKLTSYIQFNITSTNDTASGQDNETVAVQKITDWLLDYRDNVLALESIYSYTGQDCESAKWNFPTSLLFAVTAITTIGKADSKQENYVLAKKSKLINNSRLRNSRCPENLGRPSRLHLLCCHR
jgi:hypothetical protein